MGRPNLEDRPWLDPWEVARLVGTTKYQLKVWRRATAKGNKVGPPWYEIAVPGTPSKPRYNKELVVKWAIDHGFPLPPGEGPEAIVSWLLVNPKPRPGTKAAAAEAKLEEIDT